MKISVAMTTFNGERFLKEQIDSLLEQSRKIDEIIICDDCSYDRTYNILDEYQKKYSTIKVYKNSCNVGYRQNFINAIRKTSGDIIFLCDQDDIWNFNKVKDMVSVFENNSSIICLATSFRQIDADGEEIKVEMKKGYSNNNFLHKVVKENEIVQIPFEDFCMHNYFQGCCMAFRSDIKRELLFSFSELLPHDWQINLLASKYDGMYFYNKKYIDYRIHENNTIGIKNDNMDLLNKIKHILVLENRIDFSKSMVDTLSVAMKIDAKRCEQFEDLYDFSVKHMEYLDKKNAKGIMKLNSNYYYRKNKTLKARLMDLLYCLLP